MTSLQSFPSPSVCSTFLKVLILTSPYPSAVFLVFHTFSSSMLLCSAFQSLAALVPCICRVHLGIMCGRGWLTWGSCVDVGASSLPGNLSSKSHHCHRNFGGILSSCGYKMKIYNVTAFHYFHPFLPSLHSVLGCSSLVSFLPIKHFQVPISTGGAI